MSNQFSDVIELTVASSACLYVVCYLSKKIEKVGWLTSLLSAIGRDSFYVMGLHFFGFKIATLLFNVMGANLPLAKLVPSVGNNIGLFVVYVLFGVGIPVFLINSIRRLKMTFIK